ncbi:hypothetical protein dsx2_1661 [Desulfovibrio sp. X2]|uniref:tetratricopeptide repeat protein n=1 Tax=Desulfovibrio sp. X2 TaxID=941449 RepID=UPI0003589CFA|nr:tetratricopeptide repeat protein [Desulfovibrio sp. X2]EPR44300.1 hypothetical protein dsx2_1661 [Desulfovibrio sp. X2]
MSHLDYEINKELGECYLFMGDLEKAEEYYAKAIGSNGVHPDPYLGLATIAVQRGDLANALGLYQKADSIESNDKSLAGMALVESETGQNASAFVHFAKALDVNPSNLIALFGLVRMGHATGRLAEVVPYLEGFLAIDPAKHDVRFSLAGCRMCLGDVEGAAAELRLILDSDPGNGPAKELYAHIRQAA